MTADGWPAVCWTDGWVLPANFGCLSGMVQIENVWIRLAQVAADDGWLEPAQRALRLFESTQNRTVAAGGLCGGIKGSPTFSGDYGRYEDPSWATKFFVDAAIRYERIVAGSPDLSAASFA